MAAIRIRGTWRLSLSIYEGARRLKQRMLGEAELDIRSATRAGLAGEFRSSGKCALVKGRVRPGNPAIVTLAEVSADGDAVEGGLEAILYIPPWWPNVDYTYDFITGTLVVGVSSAIGDKRLHG